MQNGTPNGVQKGKKKYEKVMHTSARVPKSVCVPASIWRLHENSQIWKCSKRLHNEVMQTRMKGAKEKHLLKSKKIANRQSHKVHFHYFSLQVLGTSKSTFSLTHAILISIHSVFDYRQLKTIALLPTKPVKNVWRKSQISLKKVFIMCSWWVMHVMSARKVLAPLLASIRVEKARKEKKTDQINSQCESAGKERSAPRGSCTASICLIELILLEEKEGERLFSVTQSKWLSKLN